jgi:translation initiation factor IF-2
MNITELARRLKLTTSELFDTLPELGFDIGRRAIKIDDHIAYKIVANWSIYKKQLDAKKIATGEMAAPVVNPADRKTIAIPPQIAVRDFAALAGLNVSRVLSELMKNGIFISMNEKIDFDTASIIGADLNLEIILDETASVSGQSDDKLKIIMDKQDKAHFEARPPVVVVMGHVDHGKTKLLDAIRETNVVAGEAGGITQHIGAYQIEQRGQLITFIDTPGHEVFTAMRSRGAKVADVAILVVAADDGVKPQTVEACHIIEQAKIPFVVAINKIDKPDADIDRVKSELSNQLHITPDDWGGKTMCVPISARDKIGIDKLLDAVLFLTEMEKEKIIANPGAPAVGTVVESKVDKGEGPVATILIQNGTLRAGEILCFNNEPLGRVRIMKNYRGEIVPIATPAMPVRISGLKSSPSIGDIVEVACNRELAAGNGKKMRLGKIKKGNFKPATQTAAAAENNAGTKFVNIVIRTDVLGSVEAIEEALEKLGTAEVKVKIIKKGLGNFTESDVHTALAAKACVLGFNAESTHAVDLLAREKGVEVKSFSIIYELVDFIKQKMEALSPKPVVRKELGTIKVLAIFKTGNNNQIIGGKVENGLVELNAKIEVARDDLVIAVGELSGLQSGKQSVVNVASGQECGVEFKGEPVIKSGDVLRVYKEM